MKYNKITSLAELNEALDNEENNFVIALGALRSSKWITYGEEEDTYEVFNLIDSSTDILTADELINETSIGEAMRKGSFYCETYDED
jgi:predicted DNA-binding protein with PD1-like motif